MSSALPYLHKLRKGQLTEFAELTDLQDYDNLTKPDLAVALDNHLQTNRSIWSHEAQLADYYRRLSQPPRASPVKREPREAKVEVTPLKEETPKSVRRRSTKAKEEVEPTDESDIPPQTPGNALSSVSVPLPPSPAIVTDAIDRQTTAFRKSISEAWKDSGVEEQSNALRATLSSVKAIQILLVALEGFSVIKEVLPLRYLTTIPAIQAIHSPEIPVKIPDLFVLVDGSFWAPFSLWLLTSVLLPLTAAYFFNLNLLSQSAGGPAANTRRSRAVAQTSFDPLSFNIAKALVSYLVYANGFTFWSLYSKFSIQKVNGSIPFQWPGMMTGSAIGTVGTLYEAILRK